MFDTMPLWFWLPLTVGALIAVTVIEFRASRRYWAEQEAADPVVVTGSGVRRDPRPYACKSVEVR